MKRFWISWQERSPDFRPMTDPPTAPILSWWRSGTGEGFSTLVALVRVANEELAAMAVLENWPPPEGGSVTWRFCEEKPAGWLPGDRFPVTLEWAKARLAA